MSRLLQARPVEISASIMCIDWLNAGKELAELEEAGVDSLHWDLIDGRFASDFTMGTSIINRFRDVSRLPSDYHLMVEEPSRLFDSFQISPGDRFTIHQECCRNLHRDLISLRRRGAKVGVALSPATPLDVLDYVMDDIDQILILAVNPGFMGQQLIPQMIKKIASARKNIEKLGLNVKIIADGNVNSNYAADMVAAGADVLVGGSSGLFKKGASIKESVYRLREAIAVGQARRNNCG